MLEPRFCYKISEKAEFAHDTETGEHVAAYTQANFEGGRWLDQEEYNSIHQKLKKGISQRLSIEEELLECITQEEYDREHE